MRNEKGRVMMEGKVGKCVVVRNLLWLLKKVVEM